VTDVPDPSVGPDDVLIRPVAAGIGEGDVALSSPGEGGHVRYAGPASLPRVLGQEVAGQVEEVGPEVTNVGVGDYVTVEAFHWCGHCEACRIPHYNYCEVPEELGRTTDGAFAERMRAPSRFCWPINDLVEEFGAGKGCDLGAMVLPLAAVYNAVFVRAGGFAPGETVVVYGSGFLALCAVALARAGGAGEILVFEEATTDVSALAEGLGASGAYDAKELVAQGIWPHQVVAEATGGYGAPLQVLTDEKADIFMQDVERSLAALGKVLCLAPQGRPTSVDMERFVVRLGRVVTARGHGGYAIFPNLIALLRTGAADVTSTILGRYPLPDAPQALARAAQEPWGRWMLADTARGEE
jgi:threonine dehydrogenase-like Zn-dependent dehydrogenase